MKRQTLHRRLALAVLALALAGCAGVPVTTMARLATKGPDYLLDAQPLELRVALDVDERIKAAATQSPVLVVVLRSADRDAPPVLERNIPLAVDTAPSARQGLPAAGAHRGWLVWRVDPAGARQFAEVQQRLRDMRAAKEKGSLGLGVKLDGLAQAFPQFMSTEVATWMLIRPEDGYYKMWSGRIADAAGKG
ncbi:MAG: hypothetical protein U1F10_13755 [Burkholderiales bacterium]